MIATGSMLWNTVQAAQTLSQQGIKARVLSMHTIKPLDKLAVLSAVETGAIISIEEHNIIGGLGSAVAEVLSEQDIRNVVFTRVGIPDEFSSHVGDQEYLRGIYSLSVKSIVSSVKILIERKASHDK
jgi:transketolase